VPGAADGGEGRDPYLEAAGTGSTRDVLPRAGNVQAEYVAQYVLRNMWHGRNNVLASLWAVHDRGFAEPGESEEWPWARSWSMSNERSSPPSVTLLTPCSLLAQLWANVVRL
jgi:hypothetical protein